MAATTKRVVMPQLGESVHEGTISKWLVKPGDKVVEFEPMLEVDTDKVSAEVPAPVSGILREILAKEGETVQAGSEIAVVETGTNGGVTATPEAPTPVPNVSAPQVADEITPAPVPKPAPAPQPTQVPVATTSAPTSEHLDSGEHRYSPAVQMTASELNVDLAKVAGTGIGGRVTKLDVQNFAAKAKAAPPAATPAATVAPSEGDQVVQLTPVRHLIPHTIPLPNPPIPHACP